MEKAYAKFFSSTQGYEELEGGLPHRGIKSLTNAPTECHSHSSTAEVVVSGKLWQDLVSWRENDFHIGAHAMPPSYYAPLLLCPLPTMSPSYHAPVYHASEP